jgi:5-methylcytosine-specific restriction endonuclease McrA
MKINTPSRPWIKDDGHRQSHRTVEPYYQSSQWKKLVDAVWARDNGMCQLCLKNGIKHKLTRGTSDRSIQGTVDHKTQRKLGGTDSLDNLWLIGSNHHDGKSAKERNEMYKR